jgi:hypothetical protein
LPVLLPHTGFVLEPDLDGLVFGNIAQVRSERVGKSYGRNWVMRPIRRRGDPVSQ